jgi:ribosomal protein L37E
MFNTIDEVKTAVAAGHRVCWRSNSYYVIQDSKGQTFVQCDGYNVPLSKGYKPGDFFVMCPRCGEYPTDNPGNVCEECDYGMAEAAWRRDMALADKSLAAANRYRVEA